MILIWLEKHPSVIGLIVLQIMIHTFLFISTRIITVLVSLNCRQLGQYWHCIISDRDYFCPSSCEQCKICKEVSHIFSELQDAYFFNPNTHIHSFENLPYKPVAWHIFSATNKKPLSIQIVKSKLSLGTITDDGEVC